MIFGTVIGQAEGIRPGATCVNMPGLPPSSIPPAGHRLHENGFCSVVPGGRTCQQQLDKITVGGTKTSGHHFTAADGTEQPCMNQHSGCMAACRDADGTLSIYGATQSQFATPAVLQPFVVTPLTPIVLDPFPPPGVTPTPGAIPVNAFAVRDENGQFHILVPA